MCDAGMDGDMYDPTISSGKHVGAQPYYNPANKRLEYKIEPLVLLDTKKEIPEIKSQKPSFIQYILNYFKK